MSDKLIIFASIIVALMVSMLPLPYWAMWVKPAWVLMVLIYWAITVPDIVSVGFAWVSGLFVDLVGGSVLGEHALTFTIVIFMVYRMQMQLRMYPLLQQCISVGMFVLAERILVYCIQGFVGELPSTNLFWLSSLTSMIFWPWLYIVLRDVKWRFNID